MHKTGFTFDEKVLHDYELKSFFNILPIDKIASVELSPDETVLDLNIYKSIGKLIETNNQSINFHTPYFAGQEKYDFSSDKNTVIKHYTKLLSIIELLRQYSVKTPTLVLHGASILNNEKSKAKDVTLSGIDYLLNFISKKNLDVNLSFETLAVNSKIIGASRSEVLNVINEFNTDKLQICWDLCHDYYNFKEYKLPEDIFIDKVNYVHIHGKHNNIKHLSVMKYFNYKYFFDNCSFDDINIEILKTLCGETYYKDLINDINLLEKIK